MIKFLCKWFKYKELGWKEIKEVFYRWTILSTPWFNVYLHMLDAKIWHDKCHNHPWWFIAIILSGGYWEMANGKMIWRQPGNILYRKAEFTHNVMTPTVNWSLIIVGKKSKQWGMIDCGRNNHKALHHWLLTRED